MQRARSLHLLELTPDLGHAVADHPAVGLDLGFARTSKEAEAAALPLQVGPAADQATGLVFEMRQLDLQLALGRRGALSENFKDKACPVDDLGSDLVLKILLLN